MFAYTPPATPFRLYDYQIPHRDRLLKILSHNYYAIDLSMLGSGKTHTYLDVYVELQKRGVVNHLLIVALSETHDKIRNICREHNIIPTIVAYTTLVSRRGAKEQKNGLLRRYDEQRVEYLKSGAVKTYWHTEFHPTANLEYMINSGTLLICDEFQKIKNDDSKATACIRTIINEIYRKQTGRFLLVSGSPMSKPEEAIAFFKTVGAYIDDDDDDDNAPRMKMSNIAKSIVDYLLTFFPEHSNELNALKSEYDRMPTELIKVSIANDLFIKYIRENFASSMVVDNKSTESVKMSTIYQPPFWDAYYYEKLVSGLKDLISVTKARGSNMVAGVILNISVIESGLIPTFIRITESRLARFPNLKIILALNGIETIETISTYFSNKGYNTLTYYGKTKDNERVSIRNKFNYPSTEHRILVGNIKMLSTGIDLDDRDGRFPRLCLARPNYEALLMYQLSYRFNRGLETKSKAQIEYIYGCITEKDEISNTYVQVNERRLLDNLQSKGEFMKNITPEQAEVGVEFPGDYPFYYEPPEAIEGYNA